MQLNIGDVIAGYRLETELRPRGAGERTFQARSLLTNEVFLIRIAEWQGSATETPLATEYQRLKLSGLAARYGVVYGVDPDRGIEYLIVPTDLPRAAAPSSIRPVPSSPPRDEPPPAPAAMSEAPPLPTPRKFKKALPSRRRASKSPSITREAQRSSPVEPIWKVQAPAQAAPTVDEDDDMVLDDDAPRTPAFGVAQADPDKLRRHSASRWYKRMNPGHNFVLTMVFGAKEIRLVATDALGVAQGQKVLTLDPNDPVVIVEPVFPGCLVSPSRLAVDLTPEKVVAKFWITPLVTSQMPDACVRIWQHDRLLDELPTPSRVVKRTVAHVCLAVGLLWPVGQQLLDWAGWSPTDEFREGFPIASQFFAFLGQTTGTVLLVALFLTLAMIFYRITRPVQASQDETNLFDTAVP